MKSKISFLGSGGPVPTAVVFVGELAHVGGANLRAANRGIDLWLHFHSFQRSQVSLEMRA